MLLNMRLKRLGELAPMKRTLTYIDGALNRATDSKSSKDIDITFDFYMKDGQLSREIKQYNKMEIL